MKEYKRKKVIEEKEVLDKIICDICEKEIKNDSKYYKVTTHEYDMGNDSIESYEYMDICSDDCLRKELENYIKLESDTKCIEIEKTYNKLI